MHVTAIIAAAGLGRRLGASVPKQLLEIGGKTMLQRTVEAFVQHPRVQDVIVVLPAGLAAAPPAWLAEAAAVLVVAGGERRQDSVANACDHVPAGTEVVLVHDAARPFVSAALIGRAIDAAAEHGAAVVAVGVSDTVKRVRISGGDRVVVRTIPREEVFLAQTPQAFRLDVLRKAVALGRSGVEATDEGALAEEAGHEVYVIDGDAENVKITTEADLSAARHVVHAATASWSAGTGYDLHRLVEGRPLILGGVTIPAERGALGHSDADVLCHAVTDAILGAAALGDIGRHFPDTDAAWKDASSLELLRRAASMVREAGRQIVNVDVVVVLERPKIAPFVDRIRHTLAGALELSVERISVKGKTNEGVDAVGRGEAIAAHAVALVTARQERERSSKYSPQSEQR